MITINDINCTQQWREANHIGECMKKLCPNSFIFHAALCPNRVADKERKERQENQKILHK